MLKMRPSTCKRSSSSRVSSSQLSSGNGSRRGCVMRMRSSTMKNRTAQHQTDIRLTYSGAGILSADEFIPKAMNGKNVLWQAGNRFEFMAEQSDMNVHGPGRRRRVITPYFIE